MTDKNSDRHGDQRHDKTKLTMMIMWGAIGIAVIALIVIGGIWTTGTDSPVEHGNPVEIVDAGPSTDEGSTDLVEDSDGNVEDTLTSVAEDASSEVSDVPVRAQVQLPTNEGLQPQPQNQTETSTPSTDLADIPSNQSVQDGSGQSERLIKEDPALPNVSTSDMAWPVSGRIVRPFGWHRYPALGEWSYMPGVTLQPHVNEPEVRAALGGRVQDVVNMGGLWRLTIVHAGGLITQYEGVADVQVRSFQIVNTGDVIGFADQSNPSGVHFTLIRAGEPVDPTGYLSGR